jgi:hypothetical protein
MWIGNSSERFDLFGNFEAVASMISKFSYLEQKCHFRFLRNQMFSKFLFSKTLIVPSRYICNQKFNLDGTTNV